MCLFPGLGPLAQTFAVLYHEPMKKAAPTMTPNAGLPPLSPRALVLFSGGLDSILAALLMREQGIEILAINFQSPFYNRPLGGSPKTDPIRTAERLALDYRVLAKGVDFLDLLADPKHGLGRNANPCVDCKIYMMKRARAIMIEEGHSFLVTGEVLGQRPMSQRLDTFALMERETGLRGRILRPLCAGRLKPTEMEEAGIVDRERLLSIMGRGRGAQIEEATRRGIEDYPSPAGGCLLTDPGFAKKVRHLLSIKERIDYTDVQLLKIGRHIRLSEKTKAIVSRNEPETIALPHYRTGGSWYLTPANFIGPDAVIVGPSDEALRLDAARILVRYGKKRPEGDYLVTATHGARTEELEPNGPYDDARLRSMLL